MLEHYIQDILLLLKTTNDANPYIQVIDSILKNYKTTPKKYTHQPVPPVEPVLQHTDPIPPSIKDHVQSTVFNYKDKSDTADVLIPKSKL
jgi:hypothetical protein